MSMRCRVVVVSLAFAACQPSATTADLPDEPPAEASGQAEEPASAEPIAAAAEGSAEAPEPLADTADPVALAADIRQAILTDDVVALEDALRELGRNLSTWRAQPQPELAAALRRLSTTAAAGVRARLDARYVPAAVEMLLDAGDMGAVQRLTLAYENSVAEPVLAGPRNLATSRAPTLTLDLSAIAVGCELMLDDAPAARQPTQVVPGSHLVRCGNAGDELIVLGDPHETVRISGDHRGLLVTR